MVLTLKPLQKHERRKPDFVLKIGLYPIVFVYV